MSISPQSNHAKQLLIQIRDFDRLRLCPTGPQVVVWNDYPTESLKTFVDYTMDILARLEERENLDVYGNNFLQTFNSELNAFVAAFSGYSSLIASQITSQHHGAINRLESILTLLRSFGVNIEALVDLNTESQKIQKGLEFANQILENKVAFENSISVFKQANLDKDKFISSLISEKGQHFLDASKEYSFLNFFHGEMGTVTI